MTATVNPVILTRRNGRTATAYHIMAEGRKINTFCTARAAYKYATIYNALRGSE